LSENRKFTLNFYITQGAELPRLPVPSLEQTLAKYLQFARVIMSDDQFEKTRRAVQAFETNEGPKLQSILLDRHNDQDNWVRTLLFSMTISILECNLALLTYSI
jgi:Choline/Carnitine o-acyltransferase